MIEENEILPTVDPERRDGINESEDEVVEQAAYQTIYYVRHVVARVCFVVSVQH